VKEYDETISNENPRTHPMKTAYHYLAIGLSCILLFTACIEWPDAPDPDPISQTVITSLSVEPDTVKLGDIVTLSVSHREEDNPNFAVEWYLPREFFSGKPLDTTYLIPINGVIDSTVVQFDTSLFADSNPFFTDSTRTGIINASLRIRVVDTTNTNPLFQAPNRILFIFINYN
jgi:hypothetical protein